MEKLYWILTYLFDCASLYVVAFLWFHFPKRKSRFFAISVSFSIVLLVISFAFGFDENYGDLIVVALALVSCMLVVKKIKHLIILFGCLLAISIGQTLIATLSFWVLKLDFNSKSLEARYTYIVIYAISLGLLILACLVRDVLARKKGRQPQNWYDDNLPTLIIGIVSIAGLFFFAMFMVPAQRVSLSSDFSNYALQIMVGVTISAVMFMILIVVATSYSAHNHRLQAESHAYAKMLEQQKDYYESIRAKMESTHQLRHDIHEHMVILQHCINAGETERALQYVGHIVGIVNENKFAHTGQPLLDSLISDIFTIDVPLVWKGSFPNTILTDFDTCTLFANLLKNAYAAARVCDSPKVIVEVIRAGSEIRITIKNTVSQPVHLDSDRPTRDGGYGISNIEKVVRKYRGDICYTNIDGYFQIVIEFSGILAKA